jgi:hypothetical protein
LTDNVERCYRVYAFAQLPSHMHDRDRPKRMQLRRIDCLTDRQLTIMSLKNDDYVFEVIDDDDTLEQYDKYRKYGLS